MKKTISLLLIFALLGCDQAPKVNEEDVAAVKEADAHSGMVLEAIDVESYTYIRLDQKGQEVWLASSPITVEKGDIVRFSGEATMTDFYSKSLDRTFPAILFVAEAQKVSPDSVTLSKSLATSPDVTDLHKNMAANSVANIGSVVVEPLEGGKTIAEIFDEYVQI